MGNIASANITNLHLTNKETKHPKSQVTCPKSQSLVSSGVWLQVPANTLSWNYLSLKVPFHHSSFVSPQPVSLQGSPPCISAGLPSLYLCRAQDFRFPPLYQCLASSKTEEGHHDPCGHGRPSDFYLLKVGVRVLWHCALSQPLFPIELALLDTIPLLPF